MSLSAAPKKDENPNLTARILSKHPAHKVYEAIYDGSIEGLDSITIFSDTQRDKYSQQMFTSCSARCALARAHTRNRINFALALLGFAKRTCFARHYRNKARRVKRTTVRISKFKIR